MFKMNCLAMSLCLCVSQGVLAESNDFGSSNTKLKDLTTTDLQKTFELVGEVFVVSPDGKLMHPTAETRIWKFSPRGEIVSNFTFEAPDLKPIALSHKWVLHDDGRMTGHIQQFESMTRTERPLKDSVVKRGQLLREQDVELKDFSPVIWVAESDAKKRVIVRFLPRLAEKSDAFEIGNYPVTLHNPVIFDNKGHLWTRGNDLEGKYVSMKTHLGRFAISYFPFQGAKPIGTAVGSRIVLDAGSGLELSIQSEQPILAAHQPLKVYGIVDLEKRSEGPKSVYSFSSNTEKGLLENQR